MIRRLLLITVILFLHTSLQASPYNQWWEAGNRFYKAKQYDSAAFYFEKIAAKKPAEAVVYYNLGNAYYRLNEIGPAVLNYERALKIKPGYQDAKDNLALTRARIPNRLPVAEDIFFVRWWKSITSASTTTTWAVISLLLFLAIIAISILKLLGKLNINTQKIQLFLSAAWILSLILAFSATMHKTNQTAVVMEDSPLMNNSKGGKSAGNISEGITVDIEEEAGGMTAVTLPDGRSGWINSSSLAKI
jgi:tetratricopeptide (TPR) repeat protein